jgi:hypothetical protein
MSQRRKRPIGITLLAAVFLWIGCIGTLAFPLFALSGAVTVLLDNLVSGWFDSELVVRIVSALLTLVWFLFYVVYAITGIALWRLKSWGRKIAFVLFAGGAAISAVFVPIFMRPSELILPALTGLVVPYSLIAWYLTRPKVRAAFGEIAIEEASTTATHAFRPHLKKVWMGLGIVAVIAVFVGTLWYAVSNMIRSSDPYRIAIQQAEKSTCVNALIGTQFEAGGWSMTGGIQESADEGSADLNIPVRGHVGKGRLRVSSVKRQGIWNIKAMALSTDTREIQIVPIEDACQ